MCTQAKNADCASVLKAFMAVFIFAEASVAIAVASLLWL
jgi:hypothetical protein